MVALRGKMAANLCCPHVYAGKQLLLVFPLYPRRCHICRGIDCQNRRHHTFYQQFGLPRWRWGLRLVWTPCYVTGIKTIWCLQAGGGTEFQTSTLSWALIYCTRVPRSPVELVFVSLFADNWGLFKAQLRNKNRKHGQLSGEQNRPPFVNEFLQGLTEHSKCEDLSAENRVALRALPIVLHSTWTAHRVWH